MRKPALQKKIDREVNKAWESWELILYRRLWDMDDLIQTIRLDLSKAGMPLKESEEFLWQQITDMDAQIQERKEAERKRDREKLKELKKQEAKKR